jgi:hypothetical protein
MNNVKTAKATVELTKGDDGTFLNVEIAGRKGQSGAERAMQEFIESITYPNDIGFFRVSDLLARYRERCPGFRRAAFVAALANLGHRLGVNPAGQMVVVGRSLQRPKVLKVESGRVVRA